MSVGVFHWVAFGGRAVLLQNTQAGGLTGPHTVMSTYWDERHDVELKTHGRHAAAEVGDWYHPFFPFHWLHSVGHVRLRHPVVLSMVLWHEAPVQAAY